MTIYHAVEHRRTRIPGKIDSKAGGFYPLLISGCLMWMDATTLGLADGAHVATWYDNSSNVNNWTQSTDQRRPIYTASVINGMPGLQFTGSSDMFFAAAMTTMRTAFLVGNSNGGSYQTCFGQAAAYLWHPGQGTTWLDNGFSSANLINGTIRHNGVSMGSPGNTNRPTSATIASFHTTGNVSADQFSQDRTIWRRWIGYFSEILVYDSALSNENINLLLTYLSEKYGISVTLL